MENCDQDVVLFKALADANRLSILERLTGGELCACVLLEELNFSQSTLSHHMKILCEAGIVSCRKEGRWSHYSLNGDGLGKAENTVRNLLNAASVHKTNPDLRCS